jgi:hypothetical protein
LPHQPQAPEEEQASPLAQLAPAQQGWPAAPQLTQRLASAQTPATAGIAGRFTQHAAPTAAQFPVLSTHPPLQPTEPGS